MKYNKLTPRELYEQYSKNNLQKNTAFFDEMWYSRYFGRKVSIYFTWLFLKLRITPNTATLVSLLVGFIGAFIMAFPGQIYLVIGSIILQMYIILDSTDGELARILDKKTILGPYLDRLVHVFMYVLIFVSMGMNVYLRGGGVSGPILGLIASVIMIIAILINYIDPVVNTKSYEEYRGYESNVEMVLRNLYNFFTGDIELVLILTISGLMMYQGLLGFDVYKYILILDIVVVFFGGIVYSLYRKFRDERYQ